MKTRRRPSLMDHLLIISTLCSTATPLHLVAVQKVTGYRLPVEHQLVYQEGPEVLIVTHPNLRVIPQTNSENNAVKLWFSRFPPLIEKLVQRIQNYFSTYNNVGVYADVIHDEPYSSTVTSSSITTSSFTTSPPSTTRTTSVPPISTASLAEIDQQTQVADEGHSGNKHERNTADQK